MFEEECCKLLDQRKHTKLHWLQNPGQMIVYDLSNVKYESDER
jgi:hypothetical protein